MAVLEEKQRGQVRCDIDWLAWTKPKESVSLYRRGAPKGSYICGTACGLHQLLVMVGQRVEGSSSHLGEMDKDKNPVVTVGVLGYSIVRHRVVGMLVQMIRRGKDRPRENYFRPATAHYSQLTRTMRAKKSTEKPQLGPCLP
jgi:hypothetical protein